MSNLCPPVCSSNQKGGVINYGQVVAMSTGCQFASGGVAYWLSKATIIPSDGCGSTGICQGVPTGYNTMLPVVFDHIGQSVIGFTILSSTKPMGVTVQYGDEIILKDTVTGYSMGFDTSLTVPACCASSGYESYNKTYYYIWRDDPNNSLESQFNIVSMQNAPNGTAVSYGDMFALQSTLKIPPKADTCNLTSRFRSFQVISRFGANYSCVEEEKGFCSIDSCLDSWNCPDYFYMAAGFIESLDTCIFKQGYTVIPYPTSKHQASIFQFFQVQANSEGLLIPFINCSVPNPCQLSVCGPPTCPNNGICPDSSTPVCTINSDGTVTWTCPSTSSTSFSNNPFLYILLIVLIISPLIYYFSTRKSATQREREKQLQYLNQQ